MRRFEEQARQQEKEMAEKRVIAKQYRERFGGKSE
jgi:hypothetical protein